MYRGFVGDFAPRSLDLRRTTNRPAPWWCVRWRTRTHPAFPNRLCNNETYTESSCTTPSTRWCETPFLRLHDVNVKAVHHEPDSRLGREITEPRSTNKLLEWILPQATTPLDDLKQLVLGPRCGPTKNWVLCGHLCSRTVDHSSGTVAMVSFCASIEINSSPSGEPTRPAWNSTWLQA